MLTEYSLIASTEQQEGTSSIRALGLARAQTLVADQRSLLITGQTSDGDALQRAGRDVAVYLRGRCDFREYRSLQSEELEELGVKLHGVDVQQQSTRRVGNIRDVDTTFKAACEALCDIDEHV